MVEKHRLEDEPRRTSDVRIQSEGASAGTPDAEHEMTDAHAAPVFRFAVSLALGVGVVAVLIGIFFFWLLRREIAAEVPLHPLANEREIPPEPRLQTMRGVDAAIDAARPTDPFTDQGWVEHRGASLERLSSYGWIDRPTGVVHIPIERAIEIALQRGLSNASIPSGSTVAPEKR